MVKRSQYPIKQHHKSTNDEDAEKVEGTCDATNEV